MLTPPTGESGAKVVCVGAVVVWFLLLLLPDAVLLGSVGEAVFPLPVVFGGGFPPVSDGLLGEGDPVGQVSDLYTSTTTESQSSYPLPDAEDELLSSARTKRESRSGSQLGQAETTGATEEMARAS